MTFNLTPLLMRSGHKPACHSLPSTWTQSCDLSLAVTGGLLPKAPEGKTQEQLHQGWKLVVLLEGALQYELFGNQANIAEPCFCLIYDKDHRTAWQTFDHDRPLRYIAITLSTEDGDNLLSVDGITGGLPQDDTMIIMQPASRAVTVLATQLLTLPKHRPGASFFLTGKALELFGAVEQTLCSSGVRGCLPRYDERDRLHAAREILRARMAAPPTMASLASDVGLNVRKLTEGFHALFGTTPAAFVQCERLDAAWRMIVEEDCPVSQAAWRIGYTPTAFATAFRRRFGVPPSRVRH